MRVLIVDDDPNQVELMSIILQSIGCDVLIAENGQVAVRIASSEAKVDLITMDAVMPVQDGISATKILKTNSDTAQIPILGVTASQRVVSDMLNAGANEVILKPFTTKSFLAYIHDILKDQP